jgi:hypothetical protein
VASLLVYNPNASAVVVTGAMVHYRVQGATLPTSSTAAQGNVIALGAGQVVSVPSASSISFPFGVAVGSAAAGSSFQSMGNSAGPASINDQPSQPLQFVLFVGCTVYGSDGSVNEAGEAPLLVSYYPPPPPAFQGGYYQFASPNNFIGFTPGWP